MRQLFRHARAKRVFKPDGRASTFFAAGFTDVDGRDKPGRDGTLALLALAAAARLHVVAVRSVPRAVRRYLHALPESEHDKPDQKRSAEKGR